MLFAARKLRLHPALGNPTVIIVVDRVDLDAQISSTFHAAGAPNLEKAGTCDELEQMLAQDARKIIITTIFRFGEAEGVLNDRHNIVVLADEAHRSQEVNLGRRMRRALPNAFLFGLTGTSINRADRNTFHAFGAEEDEYGYLSRYGFEESIRDGATKPLHFEPRLPELHVDREAIDAEYQELTGGLSDLDRERLSKTAARMAVLLKTPERVERICADVARHFRRRWRPTASGRRWSPTTGRPACSTSRRSTGCSRRTNRPYGEAKTHGLIVDYLGIFDDVAQAIQFDEEGITRVVTNINELVAALPAAVQNCLARFPGRGPHRHRLRGTDRAQECLPDNAARDGFAADYSYLARL